MADRRQSDRRHADQPVDVERRHGERRTYKGGCHCQPCRAAEARYRADLRLQHAKGHPPLGATMPAVEAWKLIRQLKAEHLTQAEIAGRLGLPRRRLELNRSVIRVRTHLRLRWLYRQLMEAMAEEL